MSRKKPIPTELFAAKAPLEWGIVGDQTLYTAQIPIDKQGQVVPGGIRPQAIQTFENFVHTLKCAGVSTDEVLQVLIYVTEREHLAVVNQVYAGYFNPPYPNRAAFIVSGFAREEMLIEIVAYALVPKHEIKNNGSRE